MSGYECRCAECRKEADLSAEIERLRAEVERLRADSAEMLGRLLQEARLRGEAEGRLEGSEQPGIVDWWMAENERLRLLCGEAARHLRTLPAQSEHKDVLLADRLEKAAL